MIFDTFVVFLLNIHSLSSQHPDKNQGKWSSWYWKRKVKRIKYNSCWHYIKHLVDIKCKPAFLDSKRYISHKSKNKCKRIVEVINKSCYIVLKPKKKVKKTSIKGFKYSFANHYGSDSQISKKNTAAHWSCVKLIGRRPHGITKNKDT